MSESIKYSIGDVLDRTIAMIEMSYDDNSQLEKQIHFMAYSWAPEDDRCVFCEYTFFIAPLAEVLSYPGGVLGYEADFQEEIKQYCDDCTDRDIVENYEHYNDGQPAVPINVSEISMDTPCGCYLLIDDKAENAADA